MLGEILLLFTLASFATCQDAETGIKMLRLLVCEGGNKDLYNLIEECGKNLKEAEKELDKDRKCYEGEEPTDIWFCEKDIDKIIEATLCIQEKVNEAENIEEIKAMQESAVECIQGAAEENAKK